MRVKCNVCDHYFIGTQCKCGWKPHSACTIEIRNLSASEAKEIPPYISFNTKERLTKIKDMKLKQPTEKKEMAEYWWKIIKKTAGVKST